MNQKRIEKMIPIAIEVLPTIPVDSDDTKSDTKKYIVNNDELASNYSSYIDSFGPTLRQSGLIQVVFFNEKNKDRQAINKLIFEVLKQYYGENFDGLLDNNKKVDNLKDLVKRFEDDPVKKRKLEKMVLEAVIACKLAMKTFKKVKPIENKND